jgi:outer membrane protein assembly factor BamD (BamD/ComL family)
MGMGIGSVSSAASTASVGGASQWQQNRNSLYQLSAALQSGNINAAQQAFQSLASNSPAASNPNSALAQVGQAIAAGNIDAAQQVLSIIQAGHAGQAGSSNSGSDAQQSALALASSGAVGTNVNTLV